MKDPIPPTTKTCNCRKKTDCPMNGNFLSECFIYKASIDISIICIYIYIYIYMRLSTLFSIVFYKLIYTLNENG